MDKPFTFLAALFVSSCLYDLIGVFAETTSPHTAYFIGATVGGLAVGLVWAVNKRETRP